MNKPLLVFLLFLLFGSNLRAQKTPPVIASTDKTKILLGEQFDLVVGARFTDASSLSFFTIDSLPHFEILQRAKIDTEKTDGNIVLTQKLTLTSFDSGRWQIPALSVTGTQIKTKPITIDVVFTSPFDPKQDYHDVKEILSVQKPAQTTWYWYVIGAVLLLLLIWLLFPKKKKDPNKIELDPGAYRTALAELQKLKKEELAQKDVKTFYVRMVDVFRKYLHQGKGIQSFSKTTDDLAMQVMNLNLPLDPYNDLVQTLRLSDAVKFAKFAPVMEESDRALETIRRSIELIEKR